MSVIISDAFARWLANNQSHDPRNLSVNRLPKYGITATLDADLIELVLTFQSGRSYCCMEWGCHLPIVVVGGGQWFGLRRILLAQHTTLPDRLRIHLRCVVEEGAKFFDLSVPDRDRSNSYAFKSADSFSYEVSIVEGGEP